MLLEELQQQRLEINMRICEKCQKRTDKILEEVEKRSLKENEDQNTKEKERFVNKNNKNKVF